MLLDGPQINTILMIYKTKPCHVYQQSLIVMCHVIIVFLFFNSSRKNFISSVSWLELILGQSFWALWDEVILLRAVWMLVIWLFIPFSFNSETSEKISRRWLRSLILFSFSFISCHKRVILLKLSIIVSPFEI